MDDLHRLAQSGDRRALARMLSAIESGEVDAHALLSSPAPSNGWKVMAITGAPGVGKSVLVDAIVQRWARAGHTTALLAVDPSSPRTGGALLGDRVRMTTVDDPELSHRVYVRSVATRKAIGSVPMVVEDMAAYLLSCGWNRVLIETVGAGQSELRCAAVADRIVVVEGPARGDGIQAEKAGLLELADLVLVNKCDIEGAERHAAELSESLALGEEAPEVMLVSGLKSIGVDEAATAMLNLAPSNRSLKAKMRERLHALLERRLTGHPDYNRALDDLSGGTIDIHEAMALLLSERHESSGRNDQPR